MENTKLTVRYNSMDIDSTETFINIKGGLNKGCKDVYFVRMVGVNSDYIKNIEQMDCILTGRMCAGQGKYIRLCGLPKLLNPEEVAYYTGCYEEWKRNNGSKCLLKFNQGDERLTGILGEACRKVCMEFRNNTQNVNDSIEKNFVIKILYWMDTLGVLLSGEWNERFSCKVVLSGISKKQEYLFCYFLTLLGIDVMLLLPEKDMEEIPSLDKLSKKVVLGNVNPVLIPAYDSTKHNNACIKPDAESNASEPRMPRISIQDIRRERVHSTTAKNIQRQQPESAFQQRTEKRAGKTVISDTGIRRELEFEELALLASSVVMIAVRNKKGDVISTGSGIMVGRAGYILTNSHVACGGTAYSIRIEDDEQIYETNEVIKYNQVLDLAVIRINRTLKPLPVYSGRKDLVRGQKVVAIGSPLGLFNSVSNGIISGFRRIDDVDMIQFTAPISHGSSGGAVLNMFGEVIGISTAGIDDGQNINLAVGYQYINNFIRGFI